jgi:hypothetical protein
MVGYGYMGLADLIIPQTSEELFDFIEVKSLYLCGM